MNPFASSGLTLSAFLASVSYIMPSLANDRSNAIPAIVIRPLSAEGYIKVINSENEYKYYNFKFEEQSEASLFPKHTMYLSKKNGKYGYLDAQGNVIVDYIYDDAKEQNNLGYAAVKKDGKWGSLDQKGNLSANIENSLEDYTEINFIGKWHLMKDQNINCYTK